MKYVLFLGSRLGFEALKIFCSLGVNVSLVFIEKEHSHETMKYYERIVGICNANDIPFELELNNEVVESIIRPINPEYVMSFGFRRMIPNKVCGIANIAAIGTHFSPLPRYRGFAPLNWVLINGEKETAVNLFFLVDEVDAGDIIERAIVSIDKNDDINTLFDKCILVFNELMIRLLPILEIGKIEAAAQNHELATFSCARNPEDGKINWDKSALEIYNLVRGITYPFPGAFTYYKGKKLIVWDCEIVDIPKYDGKIHGKVVKIIPKEGIVVLCKDKAILIKNVKYESHINIVSSLVVTSIRATLS